MKHLQSINELFGFGKETLIDRIKKFVKNRFQDNKVRIYSDDSGSEHGIKNYYITVRFQISKTVLDKHGITHPGRQAGSDFRIKYIEDEGYFTISAFLGEEERPKIYRIDREEDVLRFITKTLNDSLIKEEDSYLKRNLKHIEDDKKRRENMKSYDDVIGEIEDRTPKELPEEPKIPSKLGQNLKKFLD